MAGVPRVREASWRRQELLQHDNQKGLGRPKAEREQEGKNKEDKMTDWGLGLISAAGDQDGEEEKASSCRSL